jgi:hypothetical protein
MLIQPDEHQLYALAPSGQWDLPMHSRIQHLISKHLQRLCSHGGWTVLFRDPEDGRFWELTYPMSEMHGGGPARLTEISEQTARENYDIKSPAA